MKERTNEEKLDLFADLLEPVGEILSDNALGEMVKTKQKPLKAAKHAIKNHKSAVIEILALLEGVEPEEYEVNLLQLPIKLMNFINNPEVQELFTLQGQNGGLAFSGSATENTEGEEN